jgi:ribosomal protein L17
MAQGEGGTTAGGEAGHIRQKEHRSIAAASHTNILCRPPTTTSINRMLTTPQEPNQMVPKLFQKIAPRYANRPGGYTRVLRIEPLKEDQAESAILELVDSPTDMRFLMTAKTLATLPPTKQFSPKTAENVKKVIAYRKDGVTELKDMVERLRLVRQKGGDKRVLPAPRKVYPEEKLKREMHYYEDTDAHKKPNKVLWRDVRKYEEAREKGLIGKQALLNTRRKPKKGEEVLVVEEGQTGSTPAKVDAQAA